MTTATLAAVRLPLLALGLAAALASPASAAELPPAVIAVLDYQSVLRESLAAKDIRRQIEAYRKAYQQEIARDEGKLREDEEELKRQRAVLAPAAFEERRRAFESRVIDLQRRVQDRTRQLDQAFDKAMGELRNPLIPIVKELTVQMGVNVVVENSQVLVVSKSLNITDQVIQRLNQRVPSVEVPKPAN